MFCIYLCLCVHYKPITLLVHVRETSKCLLGRDFNLRELVFQCVQDEIAQKKSKRKTSYQEYSAEDHFKIDKYASENGATAAVRKFKNSHPDMKERTVRGFKSNYEDELEKAKRESRTMTKTLP